MRNGRRRSSLESGLDEWQLYDAQRWEGPEPGAGQWSVRMLALETDLLMGKM